MNESCGLLMYAPGEPLRVLLAHPGGPYWRGKDMGVWTIPKGLPLPGEDHLDAALREFFEETGIKPSPPFLPLRSIKQKGGKRVHCWAFAGGASPKAVGASTFEIEWPPRSGKRMRFPEIDAVQLFALAEARHKILPSQAPLLEELEALLGAPR